MRHRRMLLVVALAACSDLDAAPPGQGSSLAATVQAASARMHARFGAARRVQEAIVHGDLDRAHAEVRTIAELEEPAALPAWQPYFAAVRSAAGEIERAENPVTAARLVAELGRSCAHCHDAIHAKVVFAAEPAPDRNAKLPVQMFGHQWAAAQMWQGLIGPSNERWLAGARALGDAPLAIVAEGEPALGLNDDIAKVRLHAKRGVRAATGDERVTVYADLLATCVHCHATIRDR